jgi:hypothetical protein
MQQHAQRCVVCRSMLPHSHRSTQLHARRIACAAAGDAAADAATLPLPPPLFEAALPCGALTVRPLADGDVRGAALLMTRAFAGTPEAVGMDEAAEFLRAQLAKPALGLTLVARLVPTGECVVMWA